jgi:hypothetical protein
MRVLRAAVDLDGIAKGHWGDGALRAGRSTSRSTSCSPTHWNLSSSNIQGAPRERQIFVIRSGTDTTGPLATYISDTVWLT